jgi:hypothetical protein
VTVRWALNIILCTQETAEGIEITGKMDVERGTCAPVSPYVARQARFWRSMSLTLEDYMRSVGALEMVAARTITVGKVEGDDA